MKVIYNCYGSAHSSVLAAAIHTGVLPHERIPTKEEILNVPHYDKTDTEEIGTIYYFGEDELGFKVYIVGMKGSRKIVKRAIFSTLKHLGIARTELILVDTLPYVNNMTRIGGFLSRGLGLISIGRPLTVYGLQRSYNRFVNLVGDVKERLANLQ
ncbi:MULTISPECIES: DUF3189 family protein [unclassified Candidatus Frackibacter]|uniref:DUF3189 family protein n=1 Tax=unclassified Candidatus Frackibacter TaxID=2648818 RepID=UPI000795B0A7|nr:MULTISPECIES: DUF3189 family protein [unclassified Candidatus Frackibacter]KXS42307.1 MAG: hypothetical protein AWU54_1366 [Candidatus Frackibacter sp. T328-2]SEM41542.1 Protein of unknown function [Candidatus Frackibacter sp. WG12]SFL76247.1 Protein of unknown function [Candidatus Frackibacter sp. WG13]